MNDSISENTFNRLVELAALELDPSESRYLLDQINAQLNAIHELEKIPLEKEIPPARHGVPFSTNISPIPREDRIESYPDVDDLLDQVPVIHDRYIIVPDIPHTELE